MVTFCEDDKGPTYLIVDKVYVLLQKWLEKVLQQKYKKASWLLSDKSISLQRRELSFDDKQNVKEAKPLISGKICATLKAPCLKREKELIRNYIPMNNRKFRGHVKPETIPSKSQKSRIF